LSNSGIKDEWLTPLSEFVMLTRLNLNDNSISDLGLAQVQGLEYLEAILLHSTQVSDAGIKMLSIQKNLQRIYVWNTKVTQEVGDSLQKENPKLQIDLGIKEVKKENKGLKSD
jgi:Leucine-rich repeat (LRR) protein